MYLLDEFLKYLVTLYISQSQEFLDFPLLLCYNSCHCSHCTIPLTYNIQYVDLMSMRYSGCFEMSLPCLAVNSVPYCSGTI